MKYIAFTIGPIYKTLADAKKPKELFASSYLFSYIMREIIYELKQDGKEFIIPYTDDPSIFDLKNPVGLFHDRFIFKSQAGDIEKLKKSIINVFKDIAMKFSIDFSQVREYLQVHYVEKELKDDANPILELTRYLDTKELFFQTTQDNTLPKMLRKNGNKIDNFLTKNKDIVDDLKKLSYKKYYCVVHADGDKMGQAIQNTTNIKDISKSLFEYCKKANQSIKDYGGQTIFAGGDDLLFFAPPISKTRDQTIFQLCDVIAKDFNNKVPSATLSFGISIQYVKFPLYEAVENSRNLLFQKAKKEPKNNLAFVTTKHSGQSFSTVVHKDDKEVYEKFLDLTASIKQNSDDTHNFLHSIHHKINTYKTTIENLHYDKDRLQYFFDNYFNEEEHKQYRQFFYELIDFMSISKDIEQIYAALRFIKFIQGDKQ